MKKTIISISGFSRSGKDTVADIICMSNKVERYSFADPIRKVVNILFGIGTPANKNDTLKYVSRNLKKKVTYRDLCISVGELMKKQYYKNIWIDSVKNSLIKFVNNPQTEVAVITDTRYLPEIEAIKQFCEYNSIDLVRTIVFRKEALPEWTKYGLNPARYEDKKIILDNFNVDRSELEWCCAKNDKYKVIITNDSDFKDLELQVKEKFSFLEI